MAHEEVEEAELRDGEWVGVGVEVDGAEKKETDGKDRQRGWGGLVKGWGRGCAHKDEAVCVVAVWEELRELRNANKIGRAWRGVKKNPFKRNTKQ